MKPDVPLQCEELANKILQHYRKIKLTRTVEVQLTSWHPILLKLKEHWKEEAWHHIATITGSVCDDKPTSLTAITTWAKGAHENPRFRKEVEVQYPRTVAQCVAENIHPFQQLMNLPNQDVFAIEIPFYGNFIILKEFSFSTADMREFC